VTTTRQRIIDAALTLVAERGLTGVTMVAVADTAGVARATLYNHYSDVAGIVADAATAHNRHAIDGLRHTLSVVSTPPQAIEQLVRYVAMISSRGHTLATHHGFPPELRDQLAAFDTELEQQLEQILTRGVAAGDFRHDLDTAATAVLLRHMLTGVSELVAASPERVALTVDDAITTVLAAITANQHSER
jgi:AcrR family transcriptional regulator